MQYGMAIDLRKCMGCQTCSTSCKLSNNLPVDVWWNRVLTEGGDYIDTVAGQYPNNTVNFYPLACQHCVNPACVRVCPVGATFKQEETGIVIQDSEKCIGCRMCMAACPYTGVRSFLWEEPKHLVGFPIGDADATEHHKHTVEKCKFCVNRVVKGQKPKCVESCPGRARTFGDVDDPESDISKLISSREFKQLLPGEGTQPSCYYLV